jgi:hypothetical protein
VIGGTCDVYILPALGPEVFPSLWSRLAGRVPAKRDLSKFLSPGPLHRQFTENAIFQAVVRLAGQNVFMEFSSKAVAVGHRASLLKAYQDG